MRPEKSMGKDNENRKYRRYVIEGINGNVLNITDLEILNISIDGASIETPRRLELNREYTFKIKSRDNFINLRGRVVWAVLVSKEEKGSSRTVPVYRVGIKFTETLSEKANMLLDFIEKNRIKTREQRLGGVRFKIAGGDKIKVACPYGYRVKKISLSGMSIETEYPLDLNSSYPVELVIRDRKLSLAGRVVDCEKNVSEGGVKYNIDMKFLIIEDTDRELLKDFLQARE